MKYFTILFFILLASCGIQESKPSEILKVHFLDVSQGLSVLFECNSEFALYDTGKDSVDFSNILKSYSAETLEWIVLSHFHRDHIGGFLENKLKTNQIYLTKDTLKTFLQDSVFKIINKNHFNYSFLYQGDTFSFCGKKINVLWPPKENFYSENASSIVLSVSDEKSRILLTGDLPTEEEKKLLNYTRNLKSDLLQIAHHGSKTSSGIAFLEAVQPNYAIISVGKNSYGHPTEEVLNKLVFVTGDSSKILRTDLNGNICFHWEQNIGIWLCEN